MHPEFPNDTEPLGEPWQQALAMSLVVIVEALTDGDSHAAQPRPQSLVQDVQDALATINKQFPLDSPYAVDVQGYVLDILQLFLVFWRRTHPA